jgi:hypothetical protein
MGFVVTAAELMEGSELLTQRFSAEGGPEKLQTLIEEAYGILHDLTCRSFGDGDLETPGEEVPTWLGPTAIRAMRLKAEQMVLRTGSAKERKRGAGRGNLASFRAGSYAESYFGPGEIAKSKTLDSDTSVAEALWALCTDACKEKWLALWSDVPAPAAGIIGIEWSDRPGGY